MTDIVNFHIPLTGRIRKISPLKIILFGFVILIFIGTILLCLPISSRSGQPTSFMTSSFTATSAVCVTGLIKVDTHNYWSPFGQAVILGLIQVGGIGFMTICISAISLSHKKIGLASRELMQSSVSAPQRGGIVKMTRFILFGTLIVEFAGTVLLSFAFIPKFGLKGLWYALFHSVSAFCNAGFDLMGSEGDFSSLTSLDKNPYVCIVLSMLIVIGGLGFFVWKDLIDTRFRFKRLRMHSKAVLATSAILIFCGGFLIYLTELKNPTSQVNSSLYQIGNSLFQSVSTRTAGFNTVDLAQLTHSTIFIMVLLMIVGGSPGSTAGGLKTTTIAVLFASVISVFKKKKNVEMFGRRLEENAPSLALCVLAMYLVLGSAGAVIISTVENVPFIYALFESVSAIATVGLTTGITPQLGILSSVLLMLLMLFGRVGSLTMLLAFSNYKNRPQSQKPLEKIQIG